MPTDELIATIDATWAGVVTWLEGHSLAQTVLCQFDFDLRTDIVLQIFTNLCLHKPHAIGDKTLHAFSMAITKLVSMCRQIIHTAAVYEEVIMTTVSLSFCIFIGRF